MNTTNKFLIMVSISVLGIIFAQLEVNADDKNKVPERFNCNDSKGNLAAFGNSCVPSQGDQCIPNSCPSGSKKAEL